VSEDKIVWTESELKALIAEKIAKQKHPISSDERQALSKRRYTMLLYFIFLVFNIILAAGLVYAYIQTREGSRFGIFLIGVGIPSIYACLIYEGKLTFELP